MSTEPLPTNSTATNVNSGISETFSVIESVAEALIIADVPILGAPVFKQIWELIFTFIMGYVSKAVQQTSTDLIIDSQVSSEQSGLSKALTALVAAEKGGNPDEIKQAIQNYANANSAIFKLDGSATPS